MLTRLVWLATPVALAAALTLGGCARNSDGGIATLSVTSTDNLSPKVGETVALTVRAIMGDGTSADVTDRADCGLGGQDPPGTLEGKVFTATKPGTTDVACAFQGATGTLGITVPGSLRTTVAKVQAGDHQEGTQVELRAVVFGVDPEKQYQNFWAQDEGGGPRSGIYFRDVRDLAPVDGGAPDAGALLAETFAEGDVVEVVGTYAERNGRSVVNWTRASKVGNAAPKATDVPLVAIDAATWDGCLVRVADVVVTEATLDVDYWQVASAAKPDDAKVLIDTLLHDPGPTKGQRFKSIVGVVYPSAPRTGGALKVAIAPRGPGDLVREVSRTSLSDLQGGTVAPGSQVVVDEVVVTAVDADTQKQLVDFFGQAKGGGKRASLFFRDLRPTPGAGVAVGDVVRVSGVFAEKGGRLVLNFDAVEKTGSAAPVVAAIAPTTNLADYESALVRVDNVKVTNPELDPYSFEVTDNAPGGTTTMRVSTWLYEARVTAGQVLPYVQGVVEVDSLGSLIMPRDEGDVGAVSVRDVLAAPPPDDSPLTLGKVVVTAVRPSSRGFLDFWVQDPTGGAGSSLEVRDNRIAGATETVAVGDVINLAGAFRRPSGVPTLYYERFTKGGTANPVASPVTVADLQDIASSWQACLVELSNVEVSRLVSGGFEVVARPTTSGAPTVLVSDDLTGAFPGVALGGRFTKLRGVVYRASTRLELWPRLPADLTP